MALGTILREAREQQGFSAAQVAEATHMMIQMVEEIEREDFQRIAAPIYGRGFVKLYAEFLNIDAEPLVKEFNEIFSGSRRPVVATRAVKSAAPAPEASPPATKAPSAPAPAAGVAPAAPAAPAAGAAAATVSAGTGCAGDAAVSTADELDDLFGPRPAAPAAKAGTAGPIDHSRPRSTPAGTASPPTTHRPPLTTRFSPLRALRALRGKKGVERSALSVERSALSVERSAFIPRALRRLDDALPAGWRAGPVLAAATAGLLVIGICVGIIVRGLHHTPEQSTLERSAFSVERSTLPTPDTPAPFVINTVLPPPEPYVD